MNYGQFFIFSQERKQEEKKERKFKKKEERLKRKEQEREEKEVMTWINIFSFHSWFSSEMVYFSTYFLDLLQWLI